MGKIKDILNEIEEDKVEERIAGCKAFLENEANKFYNNYSQYHFSNEELPKTFKVQCCNQEEAFKNWKIKDEQSAFYDRMPQKYIYVDFGRDKVLSLITLGLNGSINDLTDDVIKDMPYTQTEGEIWDFEFNGFNRFGPKTGFRSKLYSSHGNKATLKSYGLLTEYIRQNNIDINNREACQSAITKFVNENRNSLTIQRCVDDSSHQAGDVSDYYKVAYAFIKIEGTLPARLDNDQVIDAKFPVSVENGKIYDKDGELFNPSIDHINGNRYDNSAANLEITTLSLNAEHSNNVKYSEIKVTNHSSQQIFCKLVYENNKTTIACYLDQECTKRIPNDCISSEVTEQDSFLNSSIVLDVQSCQPNGGQCKLYMVPVQYVMPEKDKVIYFKSIQDAAANMRFQKSNGSTTMTPEEIWQDVRQVTKGANRQGGYLDVLHFQEDYSNLGLSQLNTLNEDNDSHTLRAIRRYQKLGDFYGDNKIYQEAELDIEGICNLLRQEIAGGYTQIVSRPIINAAVIELYTEESFAEKDNFDNVNFTFPNETWRRGYRFDVGSHGKIQVKDLTGKTFSNLAIGSYAVTREREAALCPQQMKVDNVAYHIVCSNQGRIGYLYEHSGTKEYKITTTRQSKTGDCPKVSCRYDTLDKEFCHVVMATTFKGEEAVALANRYKEIDYRNGGLKVVVHHKDSNTNNYHPNNLEWVTESENSAFDKGLYGLGLYEIYNGMEYPVAAFKSNIIKSIDKASSEEVYGQMQVFKREPGNTQGSYCVNQGKSLHFHIVYNSKVTGRQEILDRTFADSSEFTRQLKNTSYFRLSELSDIKRGPSLIFRWVRFRDFRFQALNQASVEETTNLTDQIIAYMHKDCAFNVKDINTQKPVAQLAATTLAEAYNEFSEKWANGNYTLDIEPAEDSVSMANFLTVGGEPISVPIEDSKDYAISLGINIMGNTNRPDKLNESYSSEMTKMLNLMGKMK